MKSRTLIGIALILSSFAFTGGGAFVLMNALDIQQINERRNQRTAQVCSEKLDELARDGNGAVSREGANVALTLKDFSDPRGALSTASMAIMMCPNKDVVNLCIGDQCKDSNNKVILKMVLKESVKP